MGLYKRIQEDMKGAMKARDLQTLDALRMLLSSLKNKSIELKRELEDADVIAVVRSDLKKVEDSLESFVQGSREDLAQKSKEEIETLQKYLPSEMSDEDLQMAVDKVIEEIGSGSPVDIGKAMGILMKELTGKVDGTRVRDTLTKRLQK